MCANAIVVVSDPHVNSTAGLCPPEGFDLEDGGHYTPNVFQNYTWLAWQHFWTRFVPDKTKDCKTVAVVINGDIIEGVHHRMSNITSTSWEIQERAGTQVLDSIGKLFPPYKDNHKFVVRGTEVHGDTCGASEERIAKNIGAEQNEIKEYSSWQWWIDLDGTILNFAHHIEGSNSAAYETSAPMRELIKALEEAAQNKRQMPDVIVRSHRHRFVPVSIPKLDGGRFTVIVTPGWQLRTPHVEKIDRTRLPHIGGIVLRVEDNQCLCLERLYKLPQPIPFKL